MNFNIVKRSILICILAVFVLAALFAEDVRNRKLLHPELMVRLVNRLRRNMSQLN